MIRLVGLAMAFLEETYDNFHRFTLVQLSTVLSTLSLFHKSRVFRCMSCIIFTSTAGTDYHQEAVHTLQLM